MPSYNKHILFSIIVALPFIPDVFYLSLAVIGTSLIDMDHPVKRNNLILMVFFGFLASFTLYTLNLPFIFGVSLISMVIILYVSTHRGFSHSIFGVVLLSLLLGFFVIGLHSLLNGFNQDIFLILISSVLGIIVLNKKVILPFIIIVAAGIIMMHSANFSSYLVLSAILTGGISHIMLDLFTPSGVKLLNPLSFKKFNRGYGFVIFILWIIAALLYNFKIIF